MFPNWLFGYQKLQVAAVALEEGAFEDKSSYLYPTLVKMGLIDENGITSEGRWILDHRHYVLHHARNLYPIWGKLQNDRVLHNSHAINLEYYLTGLAQISPKAFPIALVRYLDEIMVSPSYILDVGCGSGWATNLFKTYYRYSFTTPLITQIEQKDTAKYILYPGDELLIGKFPTVRPEQLQNIIFFGEVLHGRTPAEQSKMLSAAHDLLAEAGVIIIFDLFNNDPFFNLTLRMCSGGELLSEDSLSKRLVALGFDDVQHIRDVDILGRSYIVGTK